MNVGPHDERIPAFLAFDTDGRQRRLGIALQAHEDPDARPTVRQQLDQQLGRLVDFIATSAPPCSTRGIIGRLVSCGLVQASKRPTRYVYTVDCRSKTGGTMPLQRLEHYL